MNTSASKANLDARNRLVERTENVLTWVRDPETGEYLTGVAGLVISPLKGEFLLRRVGQFQRTRGSLKYCKAIAEAWLRHESI